MKKLRYHFKFSVIAVIILLSCSTKKDTFINRNMHTLNTKYNVLYNGYIAFDEAKKQLDDSYEDNFWERLPIEPLKIEEEIIPMPGQSVSQSKEPQGFEKAEEKAVKAIQKHSMVIDKYERNSQIDEAYLLLGKSRYYLQRFVPALEAFTFGLENYPDANLFNETRIWKAKTHVRLQNEELAVASLKYVLKSPNISDEDFEKAHTTMAMAYTQMDSTQKVIDHLKKSTYFFTDKTQGARNMFILGQIYRENNHIDSSNMVFDALAYLQKIPRKYKVHAILERAKNYQAADSTDLTFYALQELVEDRDNRPYLDEIYYQAGLISQKNDSLFYAYQFYEKSLRHNKTKPFQKSLAYEKLGDLYFDDSQFELAGAYYDSVLQINSLDQNSKRVRKITKKRTSLNDVIYYENILSRNDSILKLVDMPQSDREKYFEEFVEKLKIKDEEEKAKKEIAELNNSGAGVVSNSLSNQIGQSGKFYFYNPQLVAVGKQQFRVRYGNRPHVDFWILSQSSGTGTTIVDKTKNTIVDNTVKYDVSFYIDQIPKEKKSIDSITFIRNDAYYNLGLIYKEQFKEYEMAATNFENYLNNKPSQNLILPTKYNLYKTYAHFNTEMSNKYRNEIVNNYSDSRFAQIILNPKKMGQLNNDENSPEFVYKSAYICYKEDDFEYALSTVNNALLKYQGLEIEAKFELLKAYLLLKTSGKKEFINKLNYVISNYPNTEESDHAENELRKIQEKNNTKGK